MKTLLTKLIISNSVNEDTQIEWGFFDNIEEQIKWKQDKEFEQKEWNYNTPGAVSYRYYNFDHYSADDLLNLSMEDFYGMTLREFLTIIKNI